MKLMIERIKIVELDEGEIQLKERTLARLIVAAAQRRRRKMSAPILNDSGHLRGGKTPMINDLDPARHQG